MSAPTQWLTTAPNPRSRPTGWDAGQRGWRTHAVAAEDDETFKGIGRRRSACGLAPAHGWDMDTFIQHRCERCVRALGLELTFSERSYARRAAAGKPFV